MVKIVVFDIETDSIDVTKANPRVFGFLDIETNKVKITTNKQEAINILDKYDFIITYNGLEYDAPILLNKMNYRIEKQKHIDLYYIFKKRQSVISNKAFSNFKLDTIIKELNISDVGKKEIDYNIFKKDSWTEEEIKDITDYLEQDLKLTADAWKWLENKFEPFKEYMSAKDIANFKHINSSMGSYTYKVVCNMCGIKEEYDFDSEKIKYEGAFVKKPIKESANGNVLCFDFASLYPMMYIHANLFSHSCSCCTKEEKWKGGALFKIKGSYCTKKQGKIEETIKNFYLLRKKYKKEKDERELVVKIIINSLYGVSGSPIFKNIYNFNTAQDCTGLGQQCIKYAIKKFEEEGYLVLYTDTDSAYVEIPEGKSKEECIKLSERIGKELSNSFPFPWDEFNFKLETGISFIAFFKDDADEFIKKNYIYLTDDKKLVVKGLKVIKKDCSRLSKKIFKEVIVPSIKNKNEYKFSKKEIERLIYSELYNNLQIAARQFSIKEKKNYKNNTSIQSIIQEKYGVGEHMMIKNKRIGVGKGVKYCSLEEAKYLKINDIDIDTFIKELSYFIKKEEKTTLDKYF